MGFHADFVKENGNPSLGNAKFIIELDEETKKVQRNLFVRNDDWAKKRDEYVARRCFEELGYEAFCRYVNLNKIDVENMGKFVPCKAVERQCSFDCWKFADCVLKGA